MANSVIIVAGGKGLRMGGTLPKQFIPIGGKPVLMHTIALFHAYDPTLRIVLVLPVEHHSYWQELCREYALEIPHVIVEGGTTRFHSVKNGLAEIAGEGLVAVHDGVRPFVSRRVVEACFRCASRQGAAVPVVELVETIRRLDGERSYTVDRSDYRAVQTPQVFGVELIKKAYRQPWSPLFTDDASVVEAMGEQIWLVEGNRENIKITTSFDLKIAESLLHV